MCAECSGCCSSTGGRFCRRWAGNVMWNLLVFHCRTAQNQHSAMCSADVGLQHSWWGQVATQEFNFIENVDVSSVLLFDRKMKCFLEWQWNRWRTFKKPGFSLLVEEFTQAGGTEHWTFCPWSNRAGIFCYILWVSLGGSEESSVLSRTQGFLGWVAATSWGDKKGTELHVRKQIQPWVHSWASSLATQLSSGPHDTGKTLNKERSRKKDMS